MRHWLKIVLHILLFTASINSLSASKKLPKPYRELKEVLPFDDFGWYNNAEPIKVIFSKNPKIKIAVEVGCFMGKSTRHIAKLLPKDGKIYAIDHWKGSEENQPGQSSWYSGVSRLYEHFLSNAIHENLAHKIIPMKMDSLTASKKLKVKPDFIYIDASHDTESVLNDLRAWYPFVKSCGIICGDDYLWPSVAKAVDQFAKENNLQVYNPQSSTFWQLKK